MLNYRQIFKKHKFGAKPSYHKKANEVQSKLFIFLETAACKRQDIDSKKQVWQQLHALIVYERLSL